ncbi:hypothetical protein PILCRDRAFT_534642 [Piloderma croceum F 1598]|uniref:CHAT domain-containing protein n=1 Tax=Piloderma croceum (strain F 1598) TaxID=765440 RepID=A0A0C3FKL1_PILCF|nr:hypothetical protein PILCRDRAFT_534642 [Piloderma croceum F 1598]
MWGNDRERRRPINMGGTSSASSHAAILDQAKALRVKREYQRRREESAERVQAWWRGVKVREELKKVFESHVGGITGLRCLVLIGGREEEALGVWSGLMVDNGEQKLLELSIGPDQSSWIVLIRQTSLLLLRSVASSPLCVPFFCPLYDTDLRICRSKYAVSHLKVLKILLSSQAPSPSPLSAGSTLGADITSYLLKHDLYTHLEKAIRSTPIEAKSTSPSLPLLTPLLTLPLLTFPSTSPSTSQFFTQSLSNLFTHILTIPLLPNRLPLNSLTGFSSRLPLGSMDVLAPAVPMLVRMSSVEGRLNLIANLVAFTSPRYANLPDAALDTYLQLFTALINAVPIKSLDSPSSGSDSDSDSESPTITVSTVSSESFSPTPPLPRPKLDPRTHKRLLTIPDIKHLKALFAASDQHPRTHLSLVSFFFSLGTIWPGRADKILSVLSVPTGDGLARELYRGFVRGLVLGRDDNPVTLIDRAEKPARLSDLGGSCWERFQRFGNLVDLEKAVAAHEEAVRLTPDGHAEKPVHLNNLGNCYVYRFKRFGDRADIEKAIAAHGQAVHLTPDDHPSQPFCQGNLGSSFGSRFDRFGDPIDLEKSITAHEQVVHLVSNSDPQMPNCLSTLGSSLTCRFEHSGNIIDIDKAISAFKQAILLTPDGHAEMPIFLNNLGVAFIRRFPSSADLGDLDKAIAALERADNQTPVGHPDKPAAMANLGGCFMHRFERSGDLNDIDKAIAAHKQAIHFTPSGHPSKLNSLNNLSNAFFCRYNHSGQLIDIDKAITASKQTVHSTPDGHAHKHDYLNSLGNALVRRFERSRDIVDIDQAISVYKQAVHLTPNGHARKHAYLKYLGGSFRHRFQRSGELDDRLAAISHLRDAATYPTGSSSMRFQAALEWARLNSKISMSSGLQGYTVALNLLPQVAWLGQTIQARHRELISMGNVASEAAAAAISAEQYDTALEWLEQGRSIVWSQLLQLRTPVDALREVQPDLADDIVRVSKALEYASSLGETTQDISKQSDQALAVEEVAQGHRRLAGEWEMLVKKARDLPGFGDFLRPKKFMQLHSAADAGPVVTINVHKVRCDALVLMAGVDEVIHIPLEGFSYKKAQGLHVSLNRLLRDADLRARSDMRVGRRVAVGTTTAGFPSILSDLWSCVVKPVLDGLAFTVSRTTDPPRVWWCATGPLAFLPIHAAGIYDESVPGSNISDYVVSSYTPTLNALISATKDRDPCRKFRGLLAVSQPNTPGYSALPGTTIEMGRIQERARNFAIRSLEGPIALVKDVVEGMETHSWVHLACHAVQDTDQPTRSLFCLQDGGLELSTIITKSFPHADFAFLSACQTAMGDEKLSEEAVHLAAGLMLAGYGGVIATMWSIRDQDAPVIADSVYSYLFSDATEPDSTKAALALHHAVKYLRQDRESPFLSWVPFIHVGM